MAYQISVGGVVVSVRSQESDLAIAPSGASRRFRVDSPRTDLHLSVRWSHHLDEGDGRLRFESGGVWKLNDRGGRLEFLCRSPIYGPIPYKAAVLEPDGREGTISLHRPYYDSGATIDPLEYPLDEILISHFLARVGGCEIHACGLVDEAGRGVLFAGHSGAGKTTIARLFESHDRVTVLSDDRIIVRPHGRGFVMYGTPWHGEAELAAAASAPLTGLFLIEHGNRNEIETLPHATLIARLISCSFPPLYDAGSVARTLEVLDALVQSVPCRRLSVVPDVSLVTLVNDWKNAQ